MEDATPLGDPRLQPVQPEPKIATGFCDPCIVYLKATPKGKLPLLAACWAQSSREVRTPDGHIYWELQGVVTVQNQSARRPSRKNLWTFSTERDETVYVTIDPKKNQVAKCTYSPLRFEDSTEPQLQWAIRFLDQKTDSALQRFMRNRSTNSAPLAKALLQCSRQNWRLISEALASFEPKKSIKLPFGKFLGHIIKSTFKPVTA